MRVLSAAVSNRFFRSLLVLLIAVVGVFSAGGSATASASYLCTGYAGCASAGYSNSGYEAASGTSYWGMYPGHNCTNYAAWRLMQNGVDASYLQGQGNAYQWSGVAAGHGIVTDNTPRVGDIAWWDSNTEGAGPDGHVAYVEQVGYGYIVTSEDNYGGDFDWTQRTPGSYYPGGFIHFGGTPTGGGATPAATVDHLTGGQRLVAPNGVLQSANGQYRLVQQSDGNLVEYTASGTPLWHTHTYTYPGATAIMQSDGNLVVYAADGVTPLWHSHTYGNPGATLLMQNDNNVVIYAADGHALWASRYGRLY